MRVIERVEALPQDLVLPGLRWVIIKNPFNLFAALCFILSVLLITLSAVRSSNYSLIVKERTLQASIIKNGKINQLLFAQEEELLQNDKIYHMAEKKLTMTLPENTKTFIIKAN